MVALSLVFAFLPLVNGLVAGGVGGYLAGSTKRALLAAALPVVVVALALGLALEAAPTPFFGWFARLTPGSVALLSAAGVVIGALLGGYIAANRENEQLGSPDHR